MKAVYFDKLTLDIDKYNFKFLLQNMDIFMSVLMTKLKPGGKIRILKGEHGFNLEAETEPLNMLELVFLRIAGADDIFRVRHDVVKFFRNQHHRINRIWLAKNGKPKQEVFCGTIDDFKDFLPSWLEEIKASIEAKEEVDIE